MTLGQIYPVLNAAHILGIALLLGAAIPMDLRLLGLLRGPPGVVPFLSRCAGVGLGLAIVTGLVLLWVNLAEYLGNPAFRIKVALLIVAALLIVVQHTGPGWKAVLAGQAPDQRVRLVAGASLVVWVAVLLAGRWIGFV